MRRLQTASVDNTNLTAYTLTDTYTADAARKISVNIYLSTIDGNGDYIAYATIQKGGAGAVYISGKTTVAVASGDTTAWFPSMEIDVESADVVKTYVKGLAGDSDTTADILTRWFEVGALVPTTADRTVDVDASGGVEVGSFQAGAITAAAIATGAIDADALATDAVNEIVDQVWDEATSGHATAGTTGKALSDAGAAGDPWAAASRTLTQGAASVITAVTGTAVTVYRDSTVTFTLTGLTDFTGWSKIWFTVKDQPETETDAESILHLLKSSPSDAATDGLLYLNATAQTKTNGSITVNSVTSITVTVAASVAANLPLGSGRSYGVKALVGTTVLPVSEDGTFTIKPATPRALS